MVGFVDVTDKPEQGISCFVNGITCPNKIYRSTPTPEITARIMTLRHEMPQPRIEVLTLVEVMKIQDLWETTLCSLVNV